MTYSVLIDGSIHYDSGTGVTYTLPAVTNGTPEWVRYRAWLDAGNSPEPYVGPDPSPDYVAFWEALLSSSAYSTVRTTAFTDLAANTVTTEFLGLLGDAKAGRPYPQALQASIWDLMDAVAFSQAQIDELNGILSATYLDSVYTLTRP